MRILVVNVGSSSCKLRVLDDGDEVVARADTPPGDPTALGDALAGLRPFEATGHRVVHGGRQFTRPVRVDGGVRQALEQLGALAPLHQPASLAALDAVMASAPDVPAVACFDTAFHATLPAEAATYAIPRRWRDDYAARRYGFHGLSHAYASRRATQLAGTGRSAGRIVTCHLGAGASLAAVSGGRCVDTTMGFTPLEGLVMATRSGSVDPGLVLWLIEYRGLSAREVADALEHQSGMAGLTGTADMHEVLQRAATGDEAAQLGVDVYLHRLCGGIAAMAASLRGLDILVFTGGVGEAAPSLRRDTVDRLALLGLTIDDDSNQFGTGDRDLSAAGGSVRTMVIEAREDIEIAHGVRATLSGQ